MEALAAIMPQSFSGLTDSAKVALVTVEDEVAAGAGEVPPEAGAHREAEVAGVGSRASREARRSLL